MDLMEKINKLKPGTRFILFNDESTDVDYQPASTITNGPFFSTRLKGMLESHYDQEVNFEIEEAHKIPDSFYLNIKLLDDDYEERLMLLKSFDY